MSFTGYIGGGGGGDTVWNGVLMIDPVNGDNATAQRNVVSKPYETVAAAYADYQEGDVLVCLPGTHTLASQLVLDTFNEVNLHMYEGSLIQGNLASPLITSVENSLQLNIYGRGSFENLNGTLGSTSPAIVSSSRLHVYEAKLFHAVSGTLFGASNGVQVLENIDEMLADASYELNFSSNDFTEPFKGIIRNCKKIGDLTNTQGMFFSMGTDDSVLFENCNFFSSGVGNGYSAFIATGVPKFKNCNFINDSFRSVFSGGSSRPSFFDCHFQQNSGTFEAFFVSSPAKFHECTFAHYGTGVAVRTFADAEFSGVNKFYAESNIQACAGTDVGVSLVSGTMIANVMNVAGVQAAQTWIFQLNTEPPTVGEIYTITDPVGGTIDYTVQAADTRDDVLVGLEAAWDAEVLADPTGYFADFNNKTLILGPGVWRLQASAINSDDNLDPDNGFVLSTNGADSIQNILIATPDFAWYGNGKFLIDENLIVPNL